MSSTADIHDTQDSRNLLGSFAYRSSVQERSFPIFSLLPIGRLLFQVQDKPRTSTIFLNKSSINWKSYSYNVVQFFWSKQVALANPIKSNLQVKKCPRFWVRRFAIFVVVVKFRILSLWQNP